MDLYTHFDKYVNNYIQFGDNVDELKLKLEHSKKVSDICVILSKSLNFTKEEIEYTKLIGLYHDIGRFEQLSKYNTYYDNDNFDHGKVGCEIINKLNIKQPIKEIMSVCTYEHNKFEISKNYDNNLLKYIKLIRDADKLDIFRVYFKYYKGKKYMPGYQPILEISDSVVECIENEKVVDYNKLKTVLDFKCIQFSWIFDINYPKTIELIKENKYLERLYLDLPPSEKLERIYNKCKFK